MFAGTHNSENRWLKGFLFFVFYFIILLSPAQIITNLINNYSFELFNTCPIGNNNIQNSSFWYKATVAGSPDYLNSCSTSSFATVPANIFGNQLPRTGNGYAGFFTYTKIFADAREYIGNGLKQILSTNKKYCVTFYLSNAENLRFASNNVGFLMTKDSIKEYSPTWPAYTLSYTPNYESTIIISDTISWTQIQSTYTANGTERFITIGNFKNDAATTFTPTKPFINGNSNNTAYYFIDDVSIVEINPADAGAATFTTNCIADSTILGTDSTEFATYFWSPSTSLSCTNCPNPRAKPTVTTKYYLTKQQCSATTVDSVIVAVITPSTAANAGADKMICPGDVVQLGSDSIPNIIYNWQNSASLSCTNCPRPMASPESTTIYVLQRQECAFISYDTVKVSVDDCDPTFVVPNVFSPNGDGVNDTWGINFSSVHHIKDFSLQIYNRWGLLVFSTNPELSTPNLKWDGRTTAGVECSEGVYFYVISFNKNDERKKLNGHISLFR